jgi:hypothetical protein
MMKGYAPPAYIEYCSSVAIPSVRQRTLRQSFSTLQLGNSESVIFRTASPWDSPLDTRLLRLGWSHHRLALSFGIRDKGVACGADACA